MKCEIDNPLTWQLHPWLPLCRGTDYVYNDNNLGILFDWRVLGDFNDERLYTVYICNLMDIKNHHDLANKKKEVYKSFDEIKAAGWKPG